LVHEASFLIATGGTVVNKAIPVGNNVLFQSADGSWLRTYDFAGKLVSSKGAFFDYLSGTVTNDAKVAGYGYPHNKDEVVEGLSIAKGSWYFMLLDASAATNTVIDKALTLTVPPSQAVTTGIVGSALDTANGALVLSIVFDGTFQLGDKTYGQAGSRGFGFAKLKLRQP
jgi:hypothetical protein